MLNMIEIIIEYITNIYVLPLIAVIIGLGILYLYDFFEKKQYPNSVYFRMAILIYVACFATIYISKLAFLQPGLSNQQQGGSVSDTQSFMPSANEIKNNFENFKTGVPTF